MWSRPSGPGSQPHDSSVIFRGSRSLSRLPFCRPLHDVRNARLAGWGLTTGDRPYRALGIILGTCKCSPYKYQLLSLSRCNFQDGGMDGALCSLLR